jgi:very-short-patch-repair endonuclease
MPASEPSGCLPVIFRIFGLGGASTDSKRAGATPLPYRRKDYLLTKAERSFYGALQQAAGNEHLIFAKIRVADLLYMPKGTQRRQSHFNRIQAKHIDFVLCDRDNIRPILAIELDDSSHAAASRQSRDQFVDEALRAAGLPLLRVPCKTGYNVVELQSQIHAAIATRE